MYVSVTMDLIACAWPTNGKDRTSVSEWFELAQIELIEVNRVTTRNLTVGYVDEHDLLDTPGLTLYQPDTTVERVGYVFSVVDEKHLLDLYRCLLDDGVPCVLGVDPTTNWWELAVA